jgi:hypothetical protein
MRCIVFPLHDPEGITFPHLNVILPDLKSIFSIAYVGITPITQARWPEQVQALADDRFFTLFPLPPGAPVGDQFLHLYRQTTLAAHPDQVLHLCFSDRLAFILQSRHRHPFSADVAAIRNEDTPVIFSRSPTAWASHPRNYFEIEQFATTVGELLFGKRLDFAWCHLAISASQLKEAVAQINNHDLSVLAEMTLAIRDSVQMQEVDWLEWEDPFLLNCVGQALKLEREGSAQETEKRLAYIIPTVQTLVRYAQG